MKRILLVLGLVLFMVSSANAFDGNRKGFILGGGMGVVPVSNWKIDVGFFGLEGSIDENNVGFGLHIIIGGAFNEHNMLVYEGNLSGFKSELFDQSAVQGFNGAVWYHYFQETGKTPFTALGLGLSYFKLEDFDAVEPGGSLLFGAGYEFSKHWQFGVYLTYGKTSDSAPGVDVSLEHANLSILFTAIAF